MFSKKRFCHPETKFATRRGQRQRSEGSHKVPWEKELLGGTKVPFVATDAFIPRRPCAGSFRRYALSG